MSATAAVCAAFCVLLAVWIWLEVVGERRPRWAPWWLLATGLTVAWLADRGDWLLYGWRLRRAYERRHGVSIVWTETDGFTVVPQIRGRFRSRCAHAAARAQIRWRALRAAWAD